MNVLPLTAVRLDVESVRESRKSCCLLNDERVSDPAEQA